MITRNEIKSYRTFCNIYIHRYEEKNGEHEGVLRALFDLIFPETNPARQEADL